MGDRSQEAHPSPGPESGDTSAGELPLSVLQEAMWLSWRLDPEAWEHIVPMPFAVDGELDLDRLRFALGELGRRHPVLRARVVTTPEGRCLSWTATSSIAFTVRTVSGELQAAVAEARARPFDLERGPLVRADVLTGREGTAVVIVAHHLVMDGAAGPMFLHDLGRAYAGEPLGAPQDPAPIAAHARRSWQLADGAEGERLRMFWRDALSGPASPVRPVLVRRRDGAPGSFSLPIAPDLETDIRRTARELGVTFFTLIFGALFVTMRHHTGDDLIISTPFHGRRGRVLKGLVGSFANILPFRQRLNDTDTYEALLRRLASDLRSGIAHGDLPLPSVLHAAGLSGPQARARTHEVVLTYWDGTQNAGVDLQRLELVHGDSRAVLRLTDATSASDYRLTVLLQQDSTGCSLVWQDTRGDIGAEELATLARDHLVVVTDMTVHPTGTLAEARALLSPARANEPANMGENAEEPEYETGPNTALPETLDALAGIWREVLNVPAAAAKDSFFELGGHSLMAATLVTRIAERLDVEVSFRDLFTHHVLGELAAIIDRRRAGAPTGRPRPPDHGSAHAADEAFPASRFQEGIWLAERLDPANARYHIPLSWEVAGRLDSTVLGRALTTLTTRHEILRTRFLDRDGLLSQQIMPPWTPEIDQADLSGMSEDDREQWLQKWSESAVGTLDPSVGRLLRAGLFSVSAERQVFTLCAHHLVLDGESVPILLRELERCHAATTGGELLPPPRHQYRDLIADSDPYSAADLDYWHERLASAPPSLGLTAPEHGGPHGGTVLPLGPRVAQALMPVRLGHHVSIFMIEAAAVASALHRWTGLVDLTFGIPMAQRGGVGMDDVIGPKMNTLVLRSRCDDRTTLAELLGAFREEIIGAFEHRQPPFEEVVRRLRPTRSPGRTPYVDVLVNNVGVAQWSGRLGTARLTPVDFVAAGTEVSKFAMTVTFAERPGTIRGMLSYRGDLVDAEEARRVARYIAEVIDRFAEWLDVPVAALGSGPENAS